MTFYGRLFRPKRNYFNPHEREARDAPISRHPRPISHFNPHEREARDTSEHDAPNNNIYFNPHEREARDN